jgi:hypothetical protein
MFLAEEGRVLHVDYGVVVRDQVLGLDGLLQHSLVPLLLPLDLPSRPLSLLYRVEILTRVPLLARLITSLAEQALLTPVVLAPLLVAVLLLLVVFILFLRLLDLLFRIVIVILPCGGAGTEGGKVSILLKEDLLPYQVLPVCLTSPLLLWLWWKFRCILFVIKVAA